MVVNVLNENLQRRTANIARALSSRNQLPILQSVLLETKDGKLQLSATDLEIGIQINVAANIEKEGAVAVPARSLLDLINSLPPGKITFKTEDKQLSVISQHSKSVFQTMPKEEFPNLHEEKGHKIAVLKKQAFEEQIGRVIFAASNDTSRPALSGVLVKPEKGPQGSGFLFVATDAFRLSVQRVISDVVEGEAQEQFLVQARAFRELLSLKEESDVSIFISKKNNQVLFEQQDSVIVGRLIEAEFPDYEKIIPSEYATRTTFDKEELQKAVKIAAIFARETDNIIRCMLNEGKITVSANTPSVGENTVETEAILKGEENAIAFNAKYLQDMFSHIAVKNMALEMTGPLNPGVFKIDGDNSYLHIIMPIRVAE